MILVFTSHLLLVLGCQTRDTLQPQSHLTGDETEERRKRWPPQVSEFLSRRVSPSGFPWVLSPVTIPEIVSVFMDPDVVSFQNWIRRTFQNTRSNFLPLQELTSRSKRYKEENEKYLRIICMSVHIYSIHMSRYFKVWLVWSSQSLTCIGHVGPILCLVITWIHTLTRRQVNPGEGRHWWED